MSLRSRGARGLLLVLALLASPVHAQTPAAPPAPAPTPAQEPASDTVPVGEISTRAQAVAEEIRTLEARLTKGEDRSDLQTELDRLLESVGPRAKDVAARVSESPTLQLLSELRVEWTSLERQIASREERLGKLIASLEQERDKLKTDRERWRRTREFESKRGTPGPILDSAKTAASDLKRGADAVQQSLEDALVLQNRFAELRAIALATLTSVEDAREQVLEHLLSRDDPPLWQVNVLEQIAKVGDLPIGTFLTELREQGKLHAERHPEAIALHLLLFALLVWALRRAYAVLRSEEPGDKADEDTATAGALLATRHPLAAAALLALAATPLLHEDLPRQIQNAVRLGIVLPAVVVLRPLLGEALRAPLYLLAAFFLVDQVREILTGAHTPGRMLFTAEMLVLAGVLTWLLRRHRLDRLPASVRGNRWLAGLGLWIRASSIAALVAALASVSGYTRLASLLGGGVLGSGYAALAVYALLRIGEGLAAALLGGGRLSPVRMLTQHRALLLSRTGRLLRALIFIAWVLIVAELFALRDPIFRGLRGLLALGFGYGAFEFTLGGLFAFALTLLGAWLLARAVHFVLDEEIFPRLGLERGVPFALATLARYAILLVGFLVALSALGFDLDRITILLGAFGVGIGFGLQTIVNNFVSGLILLFERPLKVGDWVELGNVEGIVQRIGIRASTVRTFDGADVIVPNGALVSDRVVNWTLSDRTRRLVIPVGVAYGTDPKRVIALLQDVAAGLPGVSSFPKAVVAFMGFGDSSLDFQVRAWIEDGDQLIEMRNQLGISIEAALREAGIEIPFPQRTLHLRSEEALQPEGGAAAGAPSPTVGPQKSARE